MPKAHRYRTITRLRRLGSAAAVTGFNPASIAGAVLGLDYSAVTSLFQDSGVTPVTADGQSIGQVNGTGGPARQTTAANRPVWKSAIQNGRGVLRPDGSNDFLSLVSGISLTALTMVSVCATPTSGSNRGILGGSAASGAPLFFFNTSNALSLNNDGVIVLGGGVASIVSAGWHVVAVTYDQSSGVGAFYIDNNTGLAGFTQATTFTQPVNEIGSIHSGAAFIANYDRGEDWVWNRVLTGTEIATLMSGFRSKWGI